MWWDGESECRKDCKEAKGAARRANEERGCSQQMLSAAKQVAGGDRRCCGSCGDGAEPRSFKKGCHATTGAPTSASEY